MASSPKKAPLAAAAEPAPVVETVAAAPEPAVAEPVAAAAPLKDVAKIFEAPLASLTDIQDKVRTVIDKGLSETRANYCKAKSAADEAASAIETSYASAKSGVVEINVKALEALRASADANFDFVKSVFGAKTVSEYVTLHTEFARKQVELLTGQTKELSALAQKVATESAETIKAQVAKTFKIAK